MEGPSHFSTSFAKAELRNSPELALRSYTKSLQKEAWPSFSELQLWTSSLSWRSAGSEKSVEGVRVSPVTQHLSPAALASRSNGKPR